MKHFKKWLLKKYHFNGIEHYSGDYDSNPRLAFISDVARDKSFPFTSNRINIINYFNKHNLDANVYKTFAVFWDEYLTDFANGKF